MQQRRSPNPVQIPADPADRSPSDPPPPGSPARRLQSPEATRRSWFREPKAAVWLLFALAVLFGGGRRLLIAWKARKAVVLLENPDVTLLDIEAVTRYGRAGVYELLRIFGDPASTEPKRHAAGLALSKLWRDDQLIAEEEQAIVRRGYTVNWHARRRYPRALHIEIPVTVLYHVPFLQTGDEQVQPENLEWSHKILGAGRATLENDSPWTPGAGRLTFSVYPGDYSTNGPHKIILRARVRTAGLTESWQIELPHMAFSFEFDPILQPDAILTLPDATRDQSIAAAIRLQNSSPPDGQAAVFLPLNDHWALRNPPQLAVTAPLPSDLAHNITLELDGLSQHIPAGQLILSGQSFPTQNTSSVAPPTPPIDLGPAAPIPFAAIERPGTRRIRVHLTADPQLAWAAPDTRSLWPGSTTTNWLDVEIVRR